jgi:hypothetical protein
VALVCRQLELLEPAPASAAEEIADRPAQEVAVQSGVDLVLCTAALPHQLIAALQ